MSIGLYIQCDQCLRVDVTSERTARRVRVWAADHGWKVAERVNLNTGVNLPSPHVDDRDVCMSCWNVPGDDEKAVTA